MRKLFILPIALLFFLPRATRAQDFLELVTDQASSPSFLAEPPDGTGRLFISELGGRIRIFANGALQEPNDAFLEIPNIAFGSAGEGGLHSLAFDPDFATNRKVYVAYTRDGSGTSPLETVIASYTALEGDPSHADTNSAVEILTQQSPGGGQFSNHKGGQLQFGPDDMLYFGFGDGGSGNDPMCLAQTRGVLFGKLLRIDPNTAGPMSHPHYAIPAGNPFASDPNYAPETWSLGLRNPYRFSFDRVTGDLWIGDVGQVEREEVDMSPAPNAGRAVNYGWKVHEGNLCHFANPQGASCPAYVAPCDDPGYTDPVHDYGRGTGSTIIGGFVYRGSVSSWRGRYVFGDRGSSQIFALTRTGQTWNRSTITSLGGLLSFGEDQDGDLYVMNGGGNVYRLRFDLLGGTKLQDACVRHLNERFVSAANTQNSNVRMCVDKGANAKLGVVTVDQCAEDDFNDRLARSRAAGLKTDTKECLPLPPDVGYAGIDAGMDAAIASELALARDALGDSLQAGVIVKTTDVVTRNAAACQKAVLSALNTCQRSRRAEFMRCKKLGLTKDTILESEDLAACLDQGLTDPKKSVFKDCTGDLALNKPSKASRAIANSCTKKLVDLSTAFPGCDTDDPVELAECLDAAGRCRSCELFNAADDLETDCSTRGCAP